MEPFLSLFPLPPGGQRDPALLLPPPEDMQAVLLQGGGHLVGPGVDDARAEEDTVLFQQGGHAGGQGAVREAIELLLKEQGKWDSLMQKYFDL